MVRLQPALIPSLLFCAACGLGSSSLARAQESDGQRHIVILRANTSKATQKELERAVGARRSFQNVFPGFSANLSPRDVEALKARPEVASIHVSRPMRLFSFQHNPPWGLDRLDQEARALDGRFRYQAAGKGVTAYIIDTGLKASHEDFEGRAVAAVDLSTDAGTRYENLDGHGHGTHVAGTIGSATYGVAKEVSLVGVKVFDRSGREVPDETVIAGLDWVVAHHRTNPAPSVLNMSLGGEKSDVLDLAVRNVIAEGITVVAAAGNDNIDACKASPAREPGVITVAALAEGDKKPSFSNWGSCVDVIAPGAAILSTWITAQPRSLFGTSMASPHVAGLAATVLSAFPEKTPSEVHEFIIASAVPGAAQGFPASTPNRIASQRWNATDGSGIEPWRGIWSGNFETGKNKPFPSEEGFEAAAGSTVEARLENGGWWSGANADLVLTRIHDDGTREVVAATDQPGMDDKLVHTLAETGKYILELKGVSGGKFKLAIVAR